MMQDTLMNTIDEHGKALADLVLPKLQEMARRSASPANIDLAIWNDGRICWSAYTASAGHGHLMAKTAVEAIHSAESLIKDSADDLHSRASQLEAEAAALRKRAAKYAAHERNP